MGVPLLSFLLEPHALTSYPPNRDCIFSFFPHLAHISESDFDFRSADYQGLFLSGSCLSWYLGTFCHRKHTDFSNVHSLLLGDSFISTASILCRPSQARTINHWFPSQLDIMIPGYQHDSLQAGSYRPGGVLAQRFSKLENYTYIHNTHITHIYTFTYTVCYACIMKSALGLLF